MLANIEYKLVRNNYVEMVNKPGLLIYRKRDDPIAQLTIRKDPNSYSLLLQCACPARSPRGAKQDDKQTKCEPNVI